MRIEKVIIIAAVLAETIPCIAGPFDLPRFYPPPSINWQLQQFQADNTRRLMERTLREEGERSDRMLRQFQEGERREKQTLESLRQADVQSQQK
jgi:hypothetical protein